MITDFFFIDTNSEDSTASDNTIENQDQKNTNEGSNKKRQGLLTRIFKTK